MEKATKTALVTGGNAGIGLETVRGLAEKGFHVVLMSRDLEKGIKAAQKAMHVAGSQDVEIMVCDLASLQDIRRFAADFLVKHPRLDVLVNNAGAYFSEYGETTDGIERQFAINHLAPFLLTHLLMPSLEAAPSARIVNVSSNAHYQGRMNFEDLGFKSKYDGLKAYSQSKVSNVLFTRQLAYTLKDKKITANALHPGVVRTSIGNKNSSGWTKLGWIFMKPFMITTKKGAETSIYLATSPEVEGTTGKYYVKCKEKWPSRYSQDDELALRLWEVSEMMCGF